MVYSYFKHSDCLAEDYNQAELVAVGSQPLEACKSLSALDNPMYSFCHSLWPRKCSHFFNSWLTTLCFDLMMKNLSNSQNDQTQLHLRIYIPLILSLECFSLLKFDLFRYYFMDFIFASFHHQKVRIER